MKHFFVLLFVILFAGTSAQAQFNPEKAEKSLVRVMVTGGGKMGICSGFMWKKASWIVTSLHAMKLNGSIEIEYPGGETRTARVIRVFESADLVLLETALEAQPITAAVVPLTSFSAIKPEFEEKIFAIGFNGGSLGNQTQPLQKGHANPETLWYLVREKDKASLAAVGFPSMKIPIYFLSGSLLPGFSGSPVFNSRNELIGIGDGGLERGQMNVSWCIPANNLDQLEASQVTTLPAKLGEASVLYTAEVSIDVKPEEPFQDYQSVSALLEQKYQSYAYGQFDFYQTKTRTLDEMVSTAIDAQNLNGFANEFAEMNIHLDYESSDFDFDIYEDINNGFVVAIPAGTQLTYDGDLKLLAADLSAYEGGKYFALLYLFDEHQGDPVSEFVTFSKLAFGQGLTELTVDPNYSKSFMLDDVWRADYLALSGEGFYEVEGLGNVIPTVFASILSNQTSAFYSFAVCYVPADRQDIVSSFQNGINCVEQAEISEACDYFAWMFHMIAASHLTTLSFFRQGE